MVRASWVLSLQWMVAWAALRSLTRAWTSRWSVSSSGSRCFRQERDSTLNSIFRHVQPTSVLGGVVELQPIGNPPGLCRRERLVQGRRTVRVQVVHDHPHHRGLRISFVHQPNASDGRSPPSCDAGSPPRDASPPAAHRPGTGCGRPLSGTRSPAAAEFRAGEAEMAASRPTTGSRSRQSRPPGVGGHRVRHRDPAGSSMLATNSALTLGMHHSFFCQGLRAFF